jgi:hypothetical protein
MLMSLAVVMAVTTGWSCESDDPIANHATAHRMAITIDDLPVAQPSWHTPEQMEKITTGLLAVLNAYALNADWLGTFLDALEGRGYTWVSLETAMEDPVYDRPVNGWTGRGGISWLHRWAITEGVDPSTFAGEPTVPAWVAGDVKR